MTVVIQTNTIKSTFPTNQLFLFGWWYTPVSCLSYEGCDADCQKRTHSDPSETFVAHWYGIGLTKTSDAGGLYDIHVTTQATTSTATALTQVVAGPRPQLNNLLSKIRNAQ